MHQPQILNTYEANEGKSKYALPFSFGNIKEKKEKRR